MPHINCKICNNKFYAKPRHIKIGWGKFCSIECRRRGQLTGKIVKCDYCGKEVYKTRLELKRSKSGKFFCNRSCACSWANKYKRVAANHASYTTGEATYREFLKRSGQERVCKKCGLEDKRVLVVHHLDFDRKNNELDNLIWLCCNCHFLVHQHKVKI